jgi:hypothetical protein
MHSPSTEMLLNTTIASFVLFLAADRFSLPSCIPSPVLGFVVCLLAVARFFFTALKDPDKNESTPLVFVYIDSRLNPPKGLPVSFDAFPSYFSWR